LHKVKLRN